MKNAENLTQKLALYGLGVGAAMATSAQAEILTYTGPEITGNDIYISLSAGTASATNSEGAEVHLQTKFEPNGFTKAAPSASFESVSNNAQILTETKTGQGGTNTSYTLELTNTATIGAGSQLFATGGYFNNYDPGYFSVNLLNSVGPRGASPRLGNWTAGDRAFIGLSITIDGVTEYGFADITFNGLPEPTPTSRPGTSVVTPGAAGTYTLHGFGPVIPEPTTVTTLLVAGAAGLAAMRGRRKAS